MTEPVVDEAEIRESYEAFRQDLLKLDDDPDPNSPLLDEIYADGPLKESVRQRLAEAQAAGESSPPRPDEQTAWSLLSIRVMSPTEVVVTDCYLAGGWILDADGRVIDGSIGTHEGSFHFVKGDGSRWRVVDGDSTRSEGKVGCAEQFS